MPDDPETTIFDLVNYRNAVKLYPEKGDTRVLKSWRSNGKNMVTWSQKHELNLTKTRLLKLFDHELVLKIWDAKDYCQARAKFDRPKSFKFQKPEQVESEEMQNSVIEQCENYLKQIPNDLHFISNRKFPNQKGYESFDIDIETPVLGSITNTLVAVPGLSSFKLYESSSFFL
jgi:hypothetical protein